MSTPHPSERELLQSILQPLLQDFEYWFARSRELLEREPISFLNPSEQTELLERVCVSQQEVRAAKLLFDAVGGQAGVAPSQMVGWHQIVTDCWHVSVRLRQSQQSKIEE